MDQHDNKQDQPTEIRGKNTRFDRYTVALFFGGIGVAVLGSHFLSLHSLFPLGVMMVFLGMAAYSRFRRPASICLSLGVLPFVLVFLVNNTALDILETFFLSQLAVVIILVIGRVKWSALVIVLGFFVLSAMAIPSYEKYGKRSRTAKSMEHARVICRAVADSISVVGGAAKDKGEPRVKALQISRGGEKFDGRYPVEAALLKNGDLFYSFTVHVDGTHGSGPDNPVVWAFTKRGPGDTGVYAEFIQAGGTGVESGEDLAGCKTNVEKVLVRY